jgi:hypothetical protein
VRELGRVRYQYFNAPGLSLGLDIGAFPDHYTVAVTLNGVRSAHAKRRGLRDALRWGADHAGEQLTRFGLNPVQLSLSLPEELEAIDRETLAGSA